MARLPYRPGEGLPADQRDLVASRLQETELNLFRALAHHPDLLDGLRGFMGSVWADEALSRPDRLLAILAVARRLDARYQWHQHVRMWVDDGRDPGPVLAVAEGRLDALSEPTSTLVRYADAVAADAVSDALFANLQSAFDSRTAVSVTLLAGSYVMLVSVTAALDLDLEGAFVGWHLENV